ncbi:MAG: 2-oxoisovalerate dehydrogenase component [Thermoanaerobaculia bacterium]|jgi:2-oxoisovalerate dehydrogenase E1 component|nr:2-oxoisovalerate dehydrogenase component [Thermoanaerobaculia bacterium]
MTATLETAARKTPLLARFAAFVAERHPLALRPAVTALDMAMSGHIDNEWDAAEIDALRDPLRRILNQTLSDFLSPDASAAPKLMGAVPETTPGVLVSERLHQAVAEVVDACDGFLRREAITASLSADEKREMLRGMILTRATDNRLKQFFTGGEVRYGSGTFQGKGFRSLGQEAIYAAAIRLRRGEEFVSADGWRGDVVSPMIRDLGVVLSMHNDPSTVRMVLSAQMGKAGPPMNGKDLHVGDWSRGIFPAMAPLGSPALTIAGIAMAFSRESGVGGRGSEKDPLDSRTDTNDSPSDTRHPKIDTRVAISFIGEGATSLGEWHEAINACAARKLPAIFCVQNNQTALSTTQREQSAVRVFADKAIGYGIPAITIDGTDPEAIAAAFAWATERARAGEGPALIELVAMRMCGHAHHDDMLYLGKDPQQSWTYPPLTESGYANRDQYEYWCRKDPIPTYAAKLQTEGVIAAGDLERFQREAEELVEREARAVIDAPWPDAELAGSGVLANEPRRVHIEVLDESVRHAAAKNIGLPPIEEAPAFDAKGRTFLEAVMLGVGDALRSDPRTFVYGEDVGGKYGNAFLLLKPLMKDFGDRIMNSILSEGATLGVCIGAALTGMRPIGEIQFNDFVATGFNQLVNNAAKIRYRWGGSVPMVVRMPWGGLRHAGPFHSQNTEAWFYRTPGLKIIAPSTPYDARALMASAVADPDPVLYYEHIALYRDPRVKQLLSDGAPPPIPIGKAALRRSGNDLAIISYGAYVHVGMRVAETLAKDGIESSVLDLRSLAPLDRAAVLAVARHCNRVLIIEEDTRTGSIGESLAAIIQEEAFEYLDAPIRIIGALDTPVPYSPPLEEEFLAREGQIENAARLLVNY